MRVLTALMVLLMSAVVFYSCREEELIGLPQIEPFKYTQIDADAGSWVPILLDSNQVLSLLAPAPDLPTGTVLTLERESIKKLQRNKTDAHQRALDYWATASVARWNEIARDLSAKYNLLPSSDANGVYPSPSPVNPGGYPNFPVASPPYAARMQSYLGTAMFDALIVCWKSKYTYNRAAPATADNQIQTLMPLSDLPSYPSEDAVVGAVAYTILSKMFPLEEAYLMSKFQEMQFARMVSGLNYKSDIVAGDTIGRRVARLFLERANNDGMSNAGKPHLEDSLCQAAMNKFGWCWKSLDYPQRPGLLPGFGRVKPWCFEDITTIRPGPPPAIGSPEHKASLAELRKYSENPTPETRRIANFWADGPGTYTPPGHWNRLAGKYVVESQMNPIRAARVFAYLGMALADAGISCWDVKYYYMTPRPGQDDKTLKSVLYTPNFPGYTSGHSTFSGAAAAVLRYFFPQHKAEVEKMAKEASDSRIYGVIHHRYDCEIGLSSGYQIGDTAVGIAQKDGADN